MGKAKDGSGAFRFGSSNAGADPCCGYENVEMGKLPVKSPEERNIEVGGYLPDVLPTGFLKRPNFRDRL